jgi:hypothetical protein
MLSIINLVFLFLFGVEPLAKYFSKKILFRQAQRRVSPAGGGHQGQSQIKHKNGKTKAVVKPHDPAGQSANAWLEKSNGGMIGDGY